jgi:predicted transcriptional regulator
VNDVPSAKRRFDRSQEILALIKKRGECGRQELEECLGLSGPGVAYWLRIMLKDKLIELTTKSINAPGVKYRVKMFVDRK